MATLVFDWLMVLMLPHSVRGVSKLDLLWLMNADEARWSQINADQRRRVQQVDEFSSLKPQLTSISIVKMIQLASRLHWNAIDAPTSTRRLMEDRSDLHSNAALKGYRASGWLSLPLLSPLLARRVHFFFALRVSLRFFVTKCRKQIDRSAAPLERRQNSETRI